MRDIREHPPPATALTASVSAVSVEGYGPCRMQGSYLLPQYAGSWDR